MTLNNELYNIYGLNCWKYFQNEYILCNEFLRRELPRISSNYEQLLIDNHISYNKKGDELEIFDANCFEMEKLSLPVYVYHTIKKIYVYTGKYHSEEIPTAKTVKAAETISSKVIQLIQQIEFTNSADSSNSLAYANPVNFTTSAKNFAKRLKELLKRRTICFVEFSEELDPDPPDILQTLINEYKLYVTRIYGKGGEGAFIGYIVLDIEKAETRPILTLKVPSNLIGLIKGRENANIIAVTTKINKAIALEGNCSLNIRRINVHPEN